MAPLRRISCLLLLGFLAACGGGGGGGSTGSSGGASGATGSTDNGATGGTGSATSGGVAIPVTGKVINGADGSPVPGATISWVARPQQASGSTGSTSTGADGTFGFTANPDRASNATADISVRAAGYVSTALVEAPISAGNGQVETIVLVRDNTASGSISGTVRNARTGLGLAGVTLYLSSGQRSAFDIDRARIATTASDASGNYRFDQVSAGTYTVASYSFPGFEAGRRTAIPVQSAAVGGQDVVLSPSSVVSGDIRVVLTWGQSPRDLDLHLTGPNPDASRFHVSYASKVNPIGTPPPDSAVATLDVDDTSSAGPETITLSTKLNSGVYRFSVHDYSNRSTAASTALANSGAQIELYVPGSVEVQTFFVPNQAGNVWTVFELRGPDMVSPSVTAVNTMGYTEDPSTISTQRPREAEVGAGEAVAIGTAVARFAKP